MKKKNVVVFGIILFIIVLITGGTFAYWTWNSTTNKNVVFTTAGISDYIIYDEGDSQFVGDFRATASFCESVNTTISIYKTPEASTLDLKATIYMDVNSIGANIAASDSVHWVLTQGDSNFTCSNGLSSSGVLNTGTFNGVNVGDGVITLATDVEVTLEEKKYTVWIWVDSGASDLAALAGETVDTNVWTKIDMVEGESNIVTDLAIPIANSINTSNATTLKSPTQNVTISCSDDVGVTGYYFGKSKNPTSFTAITSTKNMSKTVSVNSAGTYYLVCKDAAGNVSTSNPSAVFASYVVENRLLTVDGSKDVYNTVNYALTSKNTYVILNGTSVTASGVVTLPTGGNSSSVKSSLYSSFDSVPYIGSASINNSLVINTTDNVLVLWINRLEYTVSYNACSGTGAPSSQVKRYDETINISNTEPTRSGFEFLGWNISGCNNTAIDYNPGVSYSSNNAVTLYAVWKDIENPVISVSSTNNVATTQTVTASMTDNSGVVGYYFGKTDPNTTSVTWEAVTSATSLSKTKTIDSSGTWYFASKDAVGNKQVISKVFYKTTLTLSNGTVNPTSIITLSGNTFTLPTPTPSTNYSWREWYTTSNFSGNAITTLTPTADSTVYGKTTENLLTMSANTTISGTVSYGNTLTASKGTVSSNVLDGTKTCGNGVTCNYTYQWYINSTSSNSGGTAISGATSSSYVVGTGLLGTELIGKYIYVVVTVTGTNHSNTITLTSAVTSAITKRALTITAKAQTITYGTAITQGTGQVTVSGLATIGGTADTLSSITLTQSTTNATNGTPGTITASAGVVKNGSTTITGYYNITYNTGTLTINRNPVATTGTCSSLTYTGSAQTLATGATNATYANNSGTNATSYTVTVNADSNYAFSDGNTTKTLTCSIAKKALTITAKAQTVTYGTAITQGVDKVTVATLVSGDSLSEITLTQSTTYVTTTGTITPSAVVIKEGSTDVTSNYSITYNTGTLTINKKAITITAKAQTVTYGTAITQGVDKVTVATLVSGDSLDSITLAQSTTNVTTTGTITPSAATIKKGSTDVTSNYTITYNTGTLTINKKAITITAKAQTVTYGTAITQGVDKVTVATLASGDSLDSITLAQSTTNATTTGTIRPSAATIKNGNTDVTSYYTITYNTGTLTINPKPLNAPTNVAIDCDGKVTWSSVTNATSYQISIDNSTWTTATSGVNYLSTITASDGSRTVYVRAIPTDTNYAASSAGTASITVYEVSYDACSGTGAPSAQMKLHGCTLTLSSTSPSRTGYSFNGWSTEDSCSAATSAIYSGGDSYTTNASVTLKAVWELNSVDVTYVANLVTDITDNTDKGVTATYAESTSYLTLNGTQSTTARSLGYFNSTSFVEGEEYKFTLTHVSGSYTTTASTYNMSFDIRKSDKTNMSSRNYKSIQYPTSDSKSVTLTVNSVGASEGGIFQLWLWVSEASAITFDNYVVKVEVTKVQTVMTPYENNYILPSNPVRAGYTFNGWYTAESGGTKVTSSTVMEETTAHTLYAQWTLNKVKINFHVNGGSIATASNTGGTWTTSNSLVYRNGSILTTTINYNNKITSDGLWNYNNSSYLNITRTGYTPVSGAEWICHSGCTTASKTYGMDINTYTSADFCDASSGDCTVVLKVNWKDSAKPTCTISATAGSTTVKATYSDNVGVVGTYFAKTTTAPSSSTSFTTISSTTSSTLSKKISATGTYYFGFKDAAGNVGYCSGKASDTTEGTSCRVGWVAGVGCYCSTSTPSCTLTWNCSSVGKGYQTGSCSTAPYTGCTKTTTNGNYTCSSGTLSGTKCYVAGCTITTYSCSSGTKLSDDYCWK